MDITYKSKETRYEWTIRKIHIYLNDFVIEFKFSKIIQISKNSIYFLLTLLLLVRIVLRNLRSNWPNKEEKKKKKKRDNW